MSQSDKPFTVSDRRHFTPEGHARDGEKESEAAAEADAAAQAATATGTASHETGTPTQGEAGAARPEARGTEPAGPGGPADFSHFLLGLAAEAGRQIQGEPGAPAPPGDEVLAGARSIIAILEMLRDKTEGRRTPQEDALIAELLFQLRMAYVERTRAGNP